MYNTDEYIEGHQKKKEQFLYDYRNKVNFLQSNPLYERENHFPLSFAQQRLWFLDQLTSGMPIYNIPIAVRFVGSLNIPILEQCLNQIIQRHDILHTYFIATEGQPVQVIAPAMPLNFPIIDLQDVPQYEQDTKLQSLLAQEADISFDLTQCPLIRAVIFQLSPKNHVLLLTMHHIISDGWSISVLCQELTTFYEASCAKKLPILPALPKQYAEYATWQHTWLQGDVLQRLLTYWKQQLDGMPSVLQLPTDHPRPTVQTFQGAKHLFHLSRELTMALNKLSRQERVTLFMTLLAVFQILLYRYTGQEDIGIGAPIAGRMQGDVEELIGFFVNTLVLRTKLSSNLTFHEVLERIRATTLDAYTNQDLPFERLVEEIQSGRDLSHNPIFQVLFVLQNTPPRNTTLPGLELSFLEVERATAKFDLLLDMQEDADGLRGSFEYSVDLFDAETITRMSGHFQTLLAAVVTGPEQRIGELPLLTEVEQQQLLIEWNKGGTEYPRELCIHEIFERQAIQTPDTIAIICGEDTLTYAQLDWRANQVAHYLLSLDIQPETLVGICMERSLLVIVGMLGILKAGGAYVPLDPTYPKERLTFILKDTEIAVLLTQRQLLAKLPPTFAYLICLDEQSNIVAQQNTEPPYNKVTAQNLAYVMYTSGSTGMPKGICVTHQNVVQLVRETNYAELNEKEVFLQFAPISFDAATFEIWGCLLNGARLVVFPAYTPSLEEMGNALQYYQITTLWLTAGLFHQMVESQLQKLTSVRQLLTGGDVLSILHVQKALQAGCRVINCYGPTEGTTFTSYYPISEQSNLTKSIPIGRPLSNTHVYLLDAYFQLVPIGIPGELYISGDGLARCYLHRPELTSERFIAHPFCKEPNARLYRTGDLARYLTDGNIEFLGRNDTQVKIRGFRIELSEIKTTLSQHPAVKDVHVLALEDHSSEKRLIAYVVLNKEVMATRQELQHYLQLKLPSYMTPSRLILIDALPLTLNGKVDSSVLLSSDLVESGVGTTFVASRNTLETKISQIFKDVLGMRSISVKDNFFDIGGHSLSAMRLISRIQKLFDKPISLSVFFQNATVEGLANLLCREDNSTQYSPLVEIQPRGSKYPLFCIHPAFGDVFCYSTLAGHLGLDQPLYAFEESFLFEHQELLSVEDMAKRYIEILCISQPQGPYFLGGYSFGGYIAFEMARILCKQGQTVALLALMDTLAPLPRNQSDDEDDTRIIAVSVEQLARRWPNPPAGLLQSLLSEDELRQLSLEEQWHYFLEVAKVVNYVSPEDGLSQLHRRSQIFKNHVHAAQTYNPQGIYPNRITLFKAESTSENIPNNFDNTLGWGELSSKMVDVHIIPGTHATLLEEPHVQVLAERLEYCLNKLQPHQ